MKKKMCFSLAYNEMLILNKHKKELPRGKAWKLSFLLEMNILDPTEIIHKAQSL